MDDYKSNKAPNAMRYRRADGSFITRQESLENVILSGLATSHTEAVVRHQSEARYNVHYNTNVQRLQYPTDDQVPEPAQSQKPQLPSYGWAPGGVTIFYGPPRFTAIDWTQEAFAVWYFVLSGSRSQKPTAASVPMDILIQIHARELVRVYRTCGHQF
ncbi:hypothetical protein BKA67DRAFT_539397 [Truncatella angustata]|uniref:Uncharacterized protein n=1 Tax=Truncatella angustata TaxID=152316 RepID=A0A9P8RK56_9PEZI|nr:uncharacterized protein BKA67DRAFT_539397 [Truncatella angustata]KAH6647540.1 hypothetical protein BKA67DRAFT_539397 [Truncatella angustata]